MTHAPRTTSPARRRPAFTLIEVLIVVGIIVLMLALAVPAFRTITGARSVAGATNVVSAMLARARADAVGFQQPRGLAVYADATGQAYLAEVGPAEFPAWTNNLAPYARGTYASQTQVTALGTVTTYAVTTQDVPANTGPAANFPLASTISPAMDTAYWHVFVDRSSRSNPPPNPATSTDPTFVNSDLYFACLGIFYDLLHGADTVPLPLGVGAQVVVDSNTPAGGATRQSDGYLRVGVVGFDETGRLAYLRPGFVFSRFGQVGRAVGLANATADLNNVAFDNSGLPNPPRPIGPNIANGQAPLPQPLPSSFGLVLYDREAFAARGFGALTDATLSATAPYGTAGGSPVVEADAEAWLDANATPLLINRFNGTLVRGEQP